MAYQFGGNDRVGLIGTAIAGTLGFCYFAQRQKLAETELFYKLFTSFNDRYDQLSGALAEIAESSSPTDFCSTSNRSRLLQSLRRRILFSSGLYPRRRLALMVSRHVVVPPPTSIQDIWDEEVKTESFYGLSLDAIRAGALKTLQPFGVGAACATGPLSSVAR